MPCVLHGFAPRGVLVIQGGGLPQPIRNSMFQLKVQEFSGALSDYFFVFIRHLRLSMFWVADMSKGVNGSR